jgi:iron complex outermembrane receptor protein
MISQPEGGDEPNAEILAPASAYAQQRTYDFDIPSQDLGTALKTLARRSGEQVIFQGSAVRGKRSATLAGGIRRRAVAILIRGSGLTASRSHAAYWC